MAWRSAIKRRFDVTESVPTVPAKSQKTSKASSSPGVQAMQNALSVSLDAKEQRISASVEFEQILAHLTVELPEFVCSELKVAQEGLRWLEIKRRVCEISEPQSTSPKHAIRVVLSSSGFLSLEVLGRTVESCTEPVGRWRERLLQVAAQLDTSNRHCVGLSPIKTSALLEALGRQPAAIVLENLPYRCYRSAKCELFLTEGRAICCVKCRDSFNWLKRSVEQRQNDQALKSLAASSHCNIRFLSRGDRKTRQRRAARRRTAEEPRPVEQSEPDAGEIQLNEGQNGQMTDVANLLQTEFKGELDEVLAQTGAECSAEFEQFCRASWQKDQLRNRQGKTGNRWSVISYRLALAVYARKSSAYRALAKFPVIQLPSERQLKRLLSSAFGFGQGMNEDYIADEAKLYRNAQRKAKTPGRQIGCLIFDETKVVGKVCYNSKNESICGVSASSATLKSLVDVYQEAGQSAGSQPGQYALQFLWRDLTSNCDVIGPYWLFPKTVDTAVLLSCVYEAMSGFQKHGFRIQALVCDGASYNLALLKALCGGHRGAFGVGRVNPDAGDLYSVPCSFPNPFDLHLEVCVVPCPSHMLKNLINALYNSKPSGSKAFLWTPDSEPFGWKAIVELSEREGLRRENQSQLVLGLQQSFIRRDAWTKMNVAPAKIMQGEMVLAELAAHSSQHPEDMQTKHVLEFLRACNLLFENGMLSHQKIDGIDSPPMANILTGLDLICIWHQRLSTLKSFKPTQPKERRFLAWQTFDLLRLSAYGFKRLVETFSASNPQHYIVPHRVNGSAVESLFSQVKDRVSGPTTSLNYPTGLNRLRATAQCDYRQAGTSQSAQDQYRGSALSIERILNFK